MLPGVTPPPRKLVLMSLASPITSAPVSCLFLINSSANSISATGQAPTSDAPPRKYLTQSRLNYFLLAVSRFCAERMNVEYFSDDCIFPGPGLLMSEERIIRAMVTRVIMRRQCDNTWTPGGRGHWTGHAQTNSGLIWAVRTQPGWSNTG